MRIPSGHNPGTLILRCDASVSMGTGHVMRCLALAQAWQDFRGEAVFAMSDPSAAMVERLSAEKLDTIRLSAVAGSMRDAQETVRVAKNYSARWVVVDGYGFDANYQRALKSAGLKLLLVDDLAEAEHYFADLVLNQNTCAREESYFHREPYTRLLLGLHFALLRREFTVLSERKREVTTVGKKLLVTMGGSDPDNLTLRVAQAFASMKEFEVIAVAGPSNPHQRTLRELATVCEGRLQIVVNSTKIEELMCWADLSVIAAGGTLWELLCLGTPVLSYARNSLQANILGELDAQGVVYFLGVSGAFDGTSLKASIGNLASAPQKRSRMSELSKSLIDGLGAARICQVLQGKSAA